MIFETLSDPDELARRIVARTGGDIRLALPLGLGKANTVVNALTRLALADSAIRLEIFTALTLERPDPAGDDLAARLLGPALDRLFGAYPALEYARHLRARTLPDNIRVHEFFFQAGNWLGNMAAQRDYITANYTHALHFLLARKPNVVAQLVARQGDRFSLSCNTDITVDLLRARAAGTQDFLVAAEISDDLPFMAGTGEIAAPEIALLLDDPATRFELFSAPKRPVSLAEHAIGLHVAGLVPDGATLQIGIGSTGDAVASALLLRHRDPAVFADIAAGAPVPAARGFDCSGRFETGLYAVTEMLVQGIVELLRAGVVKREVEGACVHAGFFLDCRDFYRSLREMPPQQRARIAMVPVSFTNQLYGDEAARRSARADARFVNSAMKATLLGGVVSDITAAGQIVSGVGGQYNFVEQAFAIPGGRAVLTLPATRTRKGRVSSNIVWEHPHETIPRHLRDIVVTEYGIADLRGKSDGAAIMAMLCIADSRFQPALLARAIAAGKLAPGTGIPPRHRANTPRRLRRWLARSRAAGHLPDFPFGTDFSDVEQRLLPALERLKAASGSPVAMSALIWRGLVAGAGENGECLERMRLGRARRPAEIVMALALKGALARPGD